MALVTAPERLLPAGSPADARLLARAAVPGRIQGTALQLWAAVAADPHRADPILRRGLREARHLHSAERRFVADALYGFVRHHRWLAAATGSDDPAGWWPAWLVACGLPPEDAPEAAREVRSEAKLRSVLAGRDPVDQLALLGSIDPAFAEALLDLDDPVGFLAASNVRAPLAVRVNRARGTREALIARLADEGMPSHASDLAPDGVVLDRAVDVNTLASWRDGWFEVQDEGSQVIGALGSARERATRVVDFCAGAGGKALQAAGPGVEVLALDVRRHALDELRKRAKRAGAAVRAVPLGRDGDLPPEAAAWTGTADRVLVDAPCSGSGTLRRHPELRFRIDAALLARMPALQRELLSRAAPLVAAGGRLVYSTCSVLRAENEDVVAAFLAEHPAFAQEEIVRLGPHTHGTDGFFGAVLRRQELADV